MTPDNQLTRRAMVFITVVPIAGGRGLLASRWSGIMAVVSARPDHQVAHLQLVQVGFHAERRAADLCGVHLLGLKSALQVRGFERGLAARDFSRARRGPRLRL
jgi:hypothetical protein